MNRSMRTPMLAVLLAGAFALGGCDGNDDDDDGGNGGTTDTGAVDGGDDDGTTTDPSVPPTGGMQGEPSGDIFAIAGRGDTEEPARLDRATLDGQLDGLLGADGDAMEPVAIEDDDDVTTALRRREDGGS